MARRGGVDRDPPSAPPLSPSPDGGCPVYLVSALCGRKEPWLVWHPSWHPWRWLSQTHITHLGCRASAQHGACSERESEARGGFGCVQGLAACSVSSGSCVCVRGPAGRGGGGEESRRERQRRWKLERRVLGTHRGTHMCGLTRDWASPRGKPSAPAPEDTPALPRSCPRPAPGHGGQSPQPPKRTHPWRCIWDPHGQSRRPGPREARGLLSSHTASGGRARAQRHSPGLHL